MEFKLFIFDMDGTIVDSALDFDLMRKELDFPANAPLLEHIEMLTKKLPQERIDHFMEVIGQHEKRGALISTPMPGAEDLLKLLDDRGIRKAVLTRNSQHVAELTFKKMGWTFDSVISRDCVARPKPAPDGLFHICQSLGVAVEECCYIGDFSFDLDTARNAGMPAVLYSPEINPDLELKADLVIRDYGHITRNFVDRFLTPLGFTS